jgi:DNA-binding MarR family transcriptional regulator
LVEQMTRSTTVAPPVAPALPSRLRTVVTRLARRLRQQGESAASPTQLAALATIEREGPLTLGALAAIERVRPPTITAAVGRLEEQGLVHRRTDARDRRVSRVGITSHGRRLLAESRSRKTAYLEQQLAALSADERAILARAARILERVLEKEPT